MRYSPYDTLHKILYLHKDQLGAVDLEGGGAQISVYICTEEILLWKNDCKFGQMKLESMLVNTHFCIE